MYIGMYKWSLMQMKLYDDGILNSLACVPKAKEWMRCYVVIKTPRERTKLGRQKINKYEIALG